MLDTFKIPKLKGSLDYDICSIRIQAIIINKGFTRYIAEDLAIYTNSIVQLKEEDLKTTAIIKLALEESSLL